jgi:RNA polymerase sigma-70 factor (ECF subfamily)
MLNAFFPDRARFANIMPRSDVYMVVDGQAVAMPSAMERPDDDPAARLGALFDTHHQRLFRLARRLTRSSEDAHDLVQDTFLRAARSPAAIPDGHSSEEAWLVRVLVNICRDRWRWSAVRQRSASGSDVETIGTGSPESALMARAMVQDALQQLTPRRRAILVLYELDGTPMREIAELLGVSPVTVRWHLSVGRREMARALGVGRKP